jgi:hypothetical protein
MGAEIAGGALHGYAAYSAIVSCLLGKVSKMSRGKTARSTAALDHATLEEVCFTLGQGQGGRPSKELGRVLEAIGINPRGTAKIQLNNTLVPVAYDAGSDETRYDNNVRTAIRLCGATDTTHYMIVFDESVWRACWNFVYGFLDEPVVVGGKYNPDRMLNKAILSTGAGMKLDPSDLAQLIMCVAISRIETNQVCWAINDVPWSFGDANKDSVLTVIGTACLVCARNNDGKPPLCLAMDMHSSADKINRLTLGVLPASDYFRAPFFGLCKIRRPPCFKQLEFFNFGILHFGEHPIFGSLCGMHLLNAFVRGLRSGCRTQR